MSAGPFKLLKQGLPGGRNFDQSDLVTGSMPVWDATKQQWTMSTATSATTPTRLSAQFVVTQSAYGAPSQLVGLDPAFVFQGSATAQIRNWVAFDDYTNGDQSTVILWRKSRSGVNGTIGTIVQSGDLLGAENYYGSDGTTWATGAAMHVAVDGTPGAGSMPGRFVFATTPSGSATSLERLRINNAGQIIIGYGGVAPPQISGADVPLSVAGAANLAGFIRYANSSSSPGFIGIGQSRSGTIGSHAIAQSGDWASGIGAYASNGTTLDLLGYIAWHVDGTPGASNDMPGRFSVWTTPDGSASPLQRFRINNDGNVLILNRGNTAVAQFLQSNNLTSELDLAPSTASNYKFLAFYSQGMSTREGYIGCNGAGGYEILAETSSAQMTLGATGSDGIARTHIRIGGGVATTALGFHGVGAITKPTVTGSKGGNAALASLLTALANYGLITDSST